MSLILRRSDIYHSDYSKNVGIWRLVSDVIDGKDAIDGRGEEYLPKPSGRTDAEYLAYQTRAVLYNATSKTLDGLLGGLFRKDVKTVLPEKLEYLIDNTDGEDNGINQFTKKVAKNVLSKGRQGLLVDFPQAENIKTLADERAANLQARIQTYTPESIVNWKVVRRGSILIYTHILLEEDSMRFDGHVFKYDTFKRYRLLELDSQGFYVIKILEETEDPEDSTKVVYRQVEEIAPRLPNGERLDRIPFFMVGSIDNGHEPNKAPLYDLAQLNLAHYRNSADFEEALYLIGQPTSYITGLNKDFIEENAGNIRFGSRITWLLPEGATAGLIESQSEKQLLQKAMEHKESEMLGLGARLMQDNSSRGSESGQSVMLRRAGESSQLSCIADNINKAMTEALKLCADWMGVPSENIKFSINKDFFSDRLSHNDINALVAAWQGGAISHSVVLDNFRKGEIIDPTIEDEDILRDLEEEEPPLLLSGDITNANTGSDDQPPSTAGEVQEGG